MTRPTTALIDGDIFIVQSAYKGEDRFEFADDQVGVNINLEHAIRNVEIRIKHCLEVIGTKKCIVALSDPTRHYFRHDLYPEYKGNRRGTPPPVLRGDVRKFVEENYKVVWKPGLEADDVLGIMQTRTGRDDTVIVSTDKDMKQIPGRHLNSDDVDAGVYEVTREAGDLWHLVQTLTGDSTDNYPGRKGIGPQKAPPIAEQGWAAVVASFEKIGQTEEDALVQARLAKILQSEDWDSEKQEPILWQPRN